MRKLLIAAAAFAVSMPIMATSASAHPGYSGHRHGGYAREVRQERRECNRELRRADSRREYNRELRECRREISQARREAQRDRWNDRHDRRYGYNRW